MHDTVEFEKRGIPATVFLTQTFKNAAIHSFRAKGMDGHAFIELPHPIKQLGEHAVTIRLHSEVHATVTVTIVPA